MMWLRYAVPLIIMGLLASTWLGWTVTTWWDRRQEEKFDERDTDS